MIKSEKINFLAKKIAPNPWECTYWIDLTADREGKIWKVWNGLNWVAIFTGTGGGAVDAYTKQESDLKYATKLEMQSVADNVTDKQDTLVSGTNIKTINSQSILGSGDIKIDIPDTSSFVTDSEVDDKIAELVGSAPAALDTLNELAAALNNDANFATTITNQLSNKVDTSTYTSDKSTFALKSELPTNISQLTNDSGYLTSIPDEYVTDTELTQQLNSKQDTLVSGTNIKTVNGQSILGTGNIQLETPEGGIADAPQDGNTYGRKDGAWSAITIPDTTSFATKEELANKANTSDLSNYLTTTNAEDTYATKSSLESKLDASTYTSDKSTFATKTELQSKQDTLVSGTNIKTVNGQSILGSGNLEFTTGTGGISDAPSNGKLYGRKDANWEEVVIPVQGSAVDITSAVWDTDHYKSVIAFNDSWDIIRAVKDNKVTNFTVSRGEIDSLRNLTKVISFSVANVYMEDKYVHIILFGSDGETDTKLDIKQLTDDPLDSDGRITVTETKVSDFLTSSSLKTINNQSLVGSGNIELVTPELDNYLTKAEATDNYATKSSIADMETQTHAAATYQVKGNYVTASTTLSGYGITDAYTITQTDSAIDTKIAALVDSAPGTLDTLNELAAALGDDPNFATTITAQIASKADAADLADYVTLGVFIAHTHTVSQITDLNLGNYATTASVSQATSDATFNNGHNAVSSVTGIPVSKRLAIATISNNGSFTLASTPADGREIHVIVHNTSGSDIEITMPSGSNYVNMSGDTLTVAGSSYADINVISDGTNMYIRAL